LRGACQTKLAVKYLALTCVAMTLHKSIFRSAHHRALAAALFATSLLPGCDSAPPDPYAAAQTAIADGSPRTAMEYVEAALTERPDDPEVQLLAGDIAMALGNADRAVTEYKRVVAGAGSSSLAKAKLLEATVMANYMGAGEEALAQLSYEVPLAYTAAIGYSLAKGDYDGANVKLAEGLDQFPDDPRLITIDAERILGLGQRDKAATRLAPALAETPAVAQAHMLAGQIAMAERNLKGAKDSFGTVLKIRPNDQTAMLAMAAIARDSGDEAEAANWINKANQAGATHPVGLLFAAQMAYDAGDINRAFEMIEQVPPSIATEPSFARLRGFVDAARGQYGAAIPPLKSYLEFASDDFLARRILAESYAETGELSNAWATIAPILSDPQADISSLVFAMQLSERTGQGDPAAIRAAIEKRRNAPDISEQMVAAGTAIRAGEWAKADEIYAPLVDGIGKNDPVLLNNAAAVKSQLGRHTAAVTLARRALALAPESPQIMDTLGWALWQEGTNRNEARRILSLAREAAPSNREIGEHWAIAHADT